MDFCIGEMSIFLLFVRLKQFSFRLQERGDTQKYRFTWNTYRVLQKKQPSDRPVDSSVGSPVPPNFKVVSFGLKTAIQVRCVQPFSVATLKWGLQGATNVRSLSRAMAVFLKNPVGKYIPFLKSTGNTSSFEAFKLMDFFTSFPGCNFQVW